jgi:hypothetical protein
MAMMPLILRTGCRLQAVFQALTDAADSVGVFSSSRAAAYWGYHITRSSFFAMQGIAGLHDCSLTSFLAPVLVGRA